ncbi:MAG: S16 family serine protease [Gemmatimonadota bacterium]
MPMRGTVVYPLGVIGVQVGIRSTLEMLAAHPDDPLRVILVLAPGAADHPIDPGELQHKIGVMARLSDRLNLPGGAVQATLQGIERVRITAVLSVDAHFAARISPVEEPRPADERAEELITRVITALDALAARVDRVPDEATAILRMNTADPGRFADLVAALANFSPESKDEVLGRLDIEDRLTYILGELEDQLRRARRVEAAGVEEAEAEAAGRTPSAAERADAIRRRIQALQTELGEIDPAEREAIELLRRIEAAELPPRVAAQARATIEHLRSVDRGSSEASEARSYIDWLLHVPWTRRTNHGGTATLDLDRVRAALDDELLDLDEPKDRLLDYLAVARLRGDLYGPIPCLVGPPDVGKDSLVRAIAHGLDRPLASLDLGGRGESQLAGARRARTGARPGKLISAMRDVGVRDPVFLLEEMDRIGLGKVEGDPIEAMEEALEWDRRHAFVDRYLDLPFDLRDTLFIATAHDFYRVPRSLRELMVEIRIAGYTPEEKVEIARERMLPRIIEESGLEPGDVSFDQEALVHVARAYTRDAGMGMMRRSLATLLRTRARAKASGDTDVWEFSRERIESILGLPRYTTTPAESAPEVGVVTGLAWTSSGGRLMFIEALRMPGSGRLIITGRLGDVMRESVNAAYSYVRSRGTELNVPESAFREADVHVHFPIGAMPKDGPSAGLAVTLAIASSLSDRRVRHDISMTGEVTLRGRVLEVGGVKEKVLAAYREQILEVILPRGNERDLRDVPDDARNAIRFHFVERMDEVFDLVLLD